ncbi:M48 family metallopeptidase [Sphingomonas sp.]|uniref:M48 family metallopeptidase n=1 Tax=Sphingomonas sp. TaxID=28214 RepID=UPI001EB2C411|nr:M48 family metallopeptidase [Sphingomonas sp.]MBX3593740.1 M48 family metallopeptidase [Sphingomonas sp.]
MRWKRVATGALACGLMVALTGAAHAAQSGGFDVERASRAYLDLLQGPARAKSDAYFEGGYWLLLWGTLVTVATEGVMLFTGLSARYRGWAERVTRRRWLVPALFALPYVVTTALIALPWTIYTGYLREKHYGLMSQSAGAWAGEQAIQFGIAIIVVALLLTAVFAVIRAFPRSWWLWGAGTLLGFAAIGALIAPVFIAPLFNTYSEMPAGPLRDRIVAMAKAQNIPAEHIYVFDQSKQHKRISANVSGLGPTIRISLNDNLLNRTGADEVAAVMGHEMGHYVLGHVWKLLGAMALILAAIFYAIYRIAPVLIARFGRRWGVRDVADPAATSVFMALAAVAGLILAPVMNTLVRTNESAADAFGLDAAREPDGFAKVAMRLSEYRKIEPGPVEEFLFFDHPSGSTRVHRAMQWKKDHVPGATMVKPQIDLSKE